MNSEDTVSEICSSHGGGGGDGDSQCGHSQKRPQVVDDHDDDDNTDVAVIEKPPNFVPRPRKKARSVVGELNNECCILDSSPYKTVAVSEISVNDSDELIVTAENGQVACRDYPHSRDCCVKFPFESTPHEKHCALCYCYVCDKLAPCLSWGKGNSNSDHCHASDKEEKWEKLKHSYRLRKTQMASPTTFMVTNKLPTTMMSISHIGRGNTVGTGAIASVPLIISNDAMPLVGGSNQPHNFPSTNTLNFASQARPASSCGVSPHVPGQNERIARTGNMPMGSMGFSGHINRCQLVGGSFPSNISCNITESVGLTQFSSCSSTRSLNFPFTVNPFCGFTNVPGHIANYIQRQVPDSSNYGQGTMATVLLGSQTGLVEGNQMQMGESFNALLSMNKQSPCHVPTQIARFDRSGSMITWPKGRGMPGLGFCDQGTMATRSHGSQTRSHESQVGLVVGNNMQRMEPLNVLSLSNEPSMPHMASQIPRLGQLGNMCAGPMQRDASNTVLCTTATRSHGSQEGSVEGNQMQRMELLNVSSSSNSQGTLEGCSRTPQQAGNTYSSGQVNHRGILSRNASSVQSKTAATQLKMFREFLLGNDSEDNLFVQDDSFTDIFRNCITDPCSNSETLFMAQPSASGHTSCASSTCGPQLSLSTDFSGDMDSIIYLPANTHLPTSSTALEETIEQQTNAEGRSVPSRDCLHDTDSAIHIDGGPPYV